MLAIIVFHNRTRHRIMNLFTFSRHFKHVDIYMFDGSCWTGFRLDRYGITYAISYIGHGNAIIDQAREVSNIEAVIALDIDHRATFRWTGITIPMCNELARMIAGVDISFTWSPRHLYRKLLKYDQKRNFKIFYHWRRSNGAG